MSKRRSPHRSAVCLLAAACSLAAGLLFAENDDDWPEELPDNPHQVNQDELRFLPPAADAGWLHTDNRLTIRPQSLVDGWVDMAQCYANLDAVPAVDIVYRYREIRGLRVSELDGIGAADAGERAISLKSVEQGARLCARAQVRILEADGDGAYLMRNGPFHRRFLDGYFPMRVSLEIRYPPKLLSFRHAEPPARPGLAFDHQPGRVQVDTRFSGKLSLVFYFQRAADSGGQ